ncbi:MAG: hypothetical protein PHW69_02460 [Elusimicrobiaceae bacterium]|nr:hypothetical protein [Elusimicrobiaceae bacterium]
MGNTEGSMLNVRKKSEAKKSTRRTESILAKIPKLKSTSSSTGSKFGGKFNLAGMLGRVKKLSTKDLSLLLAGLATVAVLPISAHYMSSGSAEDSGGAGKPGFYASKAGGELFEPGLNGFAPGGTGIGGETITPLSVRDPLSLILGQEEKKPEPEASAPEYTPPPQDTRDFRDTITAAAPMAAQAVSEVISAPNIPRLNGAVRGLGAVSAGGSGGITGQINNGKITGTAGSAPSKIASSDMVNPIAMKGFSGTSSRSNKSSADAYEALKAQSNDVADIMNAGSATAAADKASKASSYTGGLSGSSLGGGGKSAKKAGSASGSGSKTTVSRQQSTAQKMAEKRAEKELELEFMAKQAKVQNKLAMEQFLSVQLPQMMITAAATPVAEKITDFVKDILNPEDANDKPKWLVCKGPDGNLITIDDAIRKMSDDKKIGEFKKSCKERRGSVVPESELNPKPSPGGNDDNDNDDDDITPDTGTYTGAAQEIVKQLRENAPGDRTTLSASKQTALTGMQAATDPSQKVAAVRPFVSQSKSVVNKYTNASKGLTKEIEEVGTGIKGWQDTAIPKMTESETKLIAKYEKVNANGDSFAGTLDRNKDYLETISISTSGNNVVNAYTFLSGEVGAINRQIQLAKTAAQQDLEARILNEQQLLIDNVTTSKTKLEQRNEEFSAKLADVSAKLTELQANPTAETMEAAFNILTAEDVASKECSSLIGCVNYVDGTEQAANNVLFGKGGLVNILPMKADYPTMLTQIQDKTKEPTLLFMKGLVREGRRIESGAFNKKIEAETSVATGLNGKLNTTCKMLSAEVRAKIGLTCRYKS